MSLSDLRRIHELKSLVHVLEVAERRKIVVVVSLVVGLVAMAFALRGIPKTYQATSRVLIVADSNGRDPSVTSIDLPSVATSTVVLSHVMDDLKLPTGLIRMKSNVKAQVAARSSIMDIGYRDTQPDRAVSVANGIADELTRYYETISTSRADATIAKLDRAIGQSQQRLHGLGLQIAAESTRAPLAQSDHAFEAVTGRLDDLAAQRALAQATLTADAAARSALDAGPAMNAVARFEKLQNDETYKTLDADKAKDAATLAATKAAFTTHYPGLPGLAAKVRDEQQSVAQRAGTVLGSPDAYSATLSANQIAERKADAVVAGDRAKLAAVDALIASATGQLNKLPAASAADGQLKLEQQAAKADYLALSGQRTTAVASRAASLSLGSVVVVDRAVRADAAVVGLNGLRLALVAFALVLGFVTLCATIAELLDPHLRRPTQIEKLYGSNLITTLSMDH